ncbi:hypothetical protein N7468_003736 [Penicillium chermesinum]|uniref:Sulfatase N-terminal domain-containing protein n=1 Tax=Penicillium chermesinum TaxID=63820 RepID=A0A9W9P798_9EURO|nr:uncharacterized protein N7468_003736 [Penicillium chermesinum]KAJ5239117.1 hypothetical protein N7468_003736 [Penicillium chermesinum]
MEFKASRCKTLGRILLSPSSWVDTYWPASRKYWFSLLFIGVISAKSLRIYSHLTSLSVDRFLLWGPTFFIQDAVCILIALALCQQFERRWVRALVAIETILASIIISGLAAANISFYTQTGAEIHWRQAHYFHRDAASIKTLLTGLTGVVIGEILFGALAYLTTPYLFDYVHHAVSAVGMAVAPLFKCWKSRDRKTKESPYEQVAIEDWDEETNGSHETFSRSRQPPQTTFTRHPSILLRVVAVLVAVYVLILRCIRPSDTAYSFLSQTVALSPFEKPPSRSQSSSFELPPISGDYSWLYNHTAVGPTPQFDWLPLHEFAGFRDWYGGADGTSGHHYDPKLDPLHISNLENDLIEPLRETLKKGGIKIKHVFLLKLESTRADVFPVKKESHLGEIITDSYSGHIPEDVEERLANLTRNAERFTGVQSGFGKPDDRFQPRGGIYATDAHTGGTFTLKSIIASVCGLAPLVADFNREYLHHIYQPCMPQILGALNNVIREHNEESEQNEGSKQSEGNQTDYRSWPWYSTLMQSITDNYDNQNHLIPALGFGDKITDEKITEDWQKKPGPAPEPYNFWGYPEHFLREYFAETLARAEQKKERVFITHLTGQTHHPWDMPVGEEYEEMISPGVFNMNRKINRYLNTIGVADRWLGEIMEVLDEAGVADETLVVMVGDHGLSVVEDGGVSACDNPHVSNFHVPLVFSHPKLPQINIDGRVTSLQIVPTILDLLVESGSLDEAGTRVIKDLLPLYEDWQFTVMNTGATWLSLRSAPKPYRLVIPLVPDVEWRFSDVSIDPYELHSLQSFNILPLLDEIEKVHGAEALQWTKDAAHIAQWWVSENWRRYEYIPENN